MKEDPRLFKIPDYSNKVFFHKQNYGLREGVVQGRIIYWISPILQKKKMYRFIADNNREMLILQLCLLEFKNIIMKKNTTNIRERTFALDKLNWVWSSVVTNHVNLNKVLIPLSFSCLIYKIGMIMVLYYKIVLNSNLNKVCKIYSPLPHTW